MQTTAQEVQAIRQTIDANTPLPAVVDQLTAVQVQIAVLEALEKNLKATLIASGLKEVCGTSTRVVISTSKPGVTVSWKALAESLNLPADQIAEFSTPKDPVTTCRVYGFN